MDVQRIELEADRIVAEELDRARQKIIENHVAVGQRTTGTTADSITIAVTTNGGVTTGTVDARPYFAALETGTQPWQSQHFLPTPRRVGLSVRPEMVYRHHRGLGRNKGCRYFSVGSSDQNNDGGVGPIP